MKNIPINDFNKPKVLPEDDEIDLRLIAGTLLRQKKLITWITGASLLVSGVFAFTNKQIWEGQFQIVLESQENGVSGLAQFTASNPLLANLAGISGGAGSQLETEVKVLESPSVLKPTYDFVKSNKAQKGENISDWTFLDWRENLNIELEKGTSVLSISYRDTDPDLVLPVIKRISKDYQSYSGRDRQRGLTQGVIYLEKQVAALRGQSEASMRRAQAYALANGLGLQDGIPALASKATERASVEASREAAQNRVNSLRQRLSSAKNIGARNVFQAPQLPANAKLFDQLQTSRQTFFKNKHCSSPTTTQFAGQNVVDKI